MSDLLPSQQSSESWRDVFLAEFSQPADRLDNARANPLISEVPKKLPRVKIASCLKDQTPNFLSLGRIDGLVFNQNDNTLSRGFSSATPNRNWGRTLCGQKMHPSLPASLRFKLSKCFRCRQARLTKHCQFDRTRSTTCCPTFLRSIGLYRASRPRPRRQVKVD